jgi:hypothetical protein
MDAIDRLDLCRSPQEQAGMDQYIQSGLQSWPSVDADETNLGLRGHNVSHTPKYEGGPWAESKLWLTGWVVWNQSSMFDLV